MGGKVLSSRVDKLLQINQQSKKRLKVGKGRILAKGRQSAASSAQVIQKVDLVLPKKIESNAGDWQHPTQTEFFVDFETVTDVVSDFNNVPVSDYDNIIYLIGVGRATKHGFKYRKFVVDRLTLSEEKRILEKFSTYVHKRAKGGYCRILHYGNHEQSTFAASCKKHGIVKSLRWLDVYQSIILKEPVTFYGSLTFGLKNIAKAMYRNKLIQSTWPEDNICKNGLDALVLAKDCHDNAVKKNIKMRRLPLMKDIVRYNEIDCRVLYEIVTYLRKHHI